MAILTGTAGNDRIYGGDEDDTITGNDGADQLGGFGGRDTLSGGPGDDSYYFTGDGDVILELEGEGRDVIWASSDCTLMANVEVLYLNGAISGTGNALRNAIQGNSADNRLDGGLGVDSLDGGAGNDTYVVDDIGDRVTELTGEGIDLVLATVNYSLRRNIENLTLTGNGNIRGIGNELANIIVGNDGDNRLDGRAGADSMTGGAGNDSYFIDNLRDTVTELGGGGTDTVFASVNWRIDDNREVENLTLVGMAHYAIGNAGDNRLVGNAADNQFYGMFGHDTFIGGAGDDSYSAESDDLIIEKAGEGRDVVMALGDYTLGANLEVLYLNSGISATGNALDNAIQGNAGGNRIDGGLGVDSLDGGQGDDTYVVDNSRDRVSEDEVSGGGVDLVLAGASFVLRQGIEDLTLTGAANLTGTGNGGDNVLVGNGGDNRLTGLDGSDRLDGGAGQDVLSGGASGDIFVFGPGSGRDVVRDFSAGEGDWLDVSAYSGGTINGGGITIVQQGADVRIYLGGGNTVTVVHSSQADVAGHIVW